MVLLQISFLWWLPLTLAGLAGPFWLFILYWRRVLHERRLEMRLEEDYVP